MTLGLLEKSLTELTSANDLSTSAFGGKRKASEEEEIVREVSSSILALRLGGSSLLVNGNTVYENIAAVSSSLFHMLCDATIWGARLRSSDTTTFPSFLLDS